MRELEKARIQKNTRLTNECFMRIRARASAQFVAVDKALKLLCQELRSTGEPIDALLKYPG